MNARFVNVKQNLNCLVQKAIIFFQENVDIFMCCFMSYAAARTKTIG
jgi:hypothetical protein